ncbi:Hypothetical predicted protein [Podarcis lilfordi]|uniref:Uncharacterized protein n=1 Tax=Podarcis lilfordi TaxID=74358 RepID=A0AA35L0X5_9SAUR|nr:Hypothetical predicted protein [Podarcis lilfordi]
MEINLSRYAELEYGKFRQKEECVSYPFYCYMKGSSRLGRCLNIFFFTFEQTTTTQRLFHFTYLQHHSTANTTLSLTAMVSQLCYPHPNRECSIRFLFINEGPCSTLLVLLFNVIRSISEQ